MMRILLLWLMSLLVQQMNCSGISLDMSQFSTILFPKGSMSPANIEKVSNLITQNPDSFEDWFKALSKPNDVKRLMAIVDFAVACMKNDFTDFREVVSSEAVKGASSSFQAMIFDFIYDSIGFAASLTDDQEEIFRLLINAHDEEAFLELHKDEWAEIEKVGAKFKTKVYDYLVAVSIYTMVKRDKYPATEEKLPIGTLAGVLLVFGQSMENASPRMRQILKANVNELRSKVPEMKEFIPTQHEDKKMSLGIKIFIGVGIGMVVLAITCGIFAYFRFKA